MWIDYAILAVLSAAMVVYAYLRRPGGSDATDDDSNGGVPSGGDAAPTDVPPAVSAPDRERERELADA